MHKFMAGLTESANAAKGKTVLYLPKEDVVDPERAAGDKDLVQVRDWGREGEKREGGVEGGGGGCRLRGGEGGGPGARVVQRAAGRGGEGGGEVDTIETGQNTHNPRQHSHTPSNLSHFTHTYTIRSSLLAPFVDAVHSVSRRPLFTGHVRSKRYEKREEKRGEGEIREWCGRVCVCHVLYAV
jgi:hypothetical protein